ncbi:MAG: hypothetical protein M3424_08900, partial [Actinomycetota bacterium]|nr:hypothetical protein [Actinomycetota bacterium]
VPGGGPLCGDACDTLPGDAELTLRSEVVIVPQIEAVGMDHPVGSVALSSTTEVMDHNVVGSFTLREPFGDYAAGLVIVAPEGTVADSLHVVITDSTAAQAAQSTVLTLIDPPSFDVVIQSPVGLAELQAEVAGDLTTFGRTFLLGVLGAGALLVAIVVLADVLVRRTDLGRRRALGATRATILSLVIARTLLPALLGAAIGTAVRLWAADRFRHPTPGLHPRHRHPGQRHTPALYAASRDPVRVLRTP